MASKILISILRVKSRDLNLKNYFPKKEFFNEFLVNVVENE